MEDRIPHKLFNQLSAAHCSEDEIAELYDDLKYIFDSPFDNELNVAITQRGCTYVEIAEQRPN
jgi:hypothetical protein